MENSSIHVLAKRLKEARQRAGYRTAKDLADASKGTLLLSTLRGYEAGIREPSLDVIRNIARLCKVDPAWLSGLTDLEAAVPESAVSSKMQFTMPDDSMRPNIQPGDLLDLEPVANSPALEGFIVFRDLDGVVMVRHFYRAPGTGFMGISTSAGDNGKPSVEYVHLDITARFEIIGRVTTLHRNMKNLF